MPAPRGRGPALAACSSTAESGPCATTARTPRGKSRPPRAATRCACCSILLDMRHRAVAMAVVMLAFMSAVGSFAPTHAERQGCWPSAGWTQLRPPGHSGVDAFGVPAVLALARSSLDPDLIYAGGPGGLYRSPDCGRTWSTPTYPTPASSPPSEFDTIIALAMDQRGTLYAGRQGAPVAISQDGGVWTALGALTRNRVKACTTRLSAMC
jgi:hypothetical protein